MNTVLYLKTVNDTYGNPRRLFILLEDGKVKKVVDEGYSGIPEGFESYPLISINITPKEYKKWLNMCKY